MKLLREAIRQILLTEGMKTPDMLPDNVVVVIQQKDSMFYRVYYALKRHPKTPSRDPYGKITFFRPIYHPFRGILSQYMIILT